MPAAAQDYWEHTWQRKSPRPIYPALALYQAPVSACVYVIRASQQPCKVDAMIIPFNRQESLRVRQIKPVTEASWSAKWQSWDLNPNCLQGSKVKIQGDETQLRNDSVVVIMSSALNTSLVPGSLSGYLSKSLPSPFKIGATVPIL